jgi:hypothetical protein
LNRSDESSGEADLARSSCARPRLLLDIDGVISLFGFPAGEPPPGSWRLVDGIPHLISARAPALLSRLAQAFTLVWCSGWEERANEHLPAALGLPAALEWIGLDGRRPQDGGEHWKLAAIDAHAGRHAPLAWIDDDLDERCRRWAAARPAPTLLVDSDPRVGLTEEHVATLLAWARARRRRGTLALAPLSRR